MTNTQPAAQISGSQAPVESHQQVEVDELQQELRQHAERVRAGWTFAKQTSDVKVSHLRFASVRARVVPDDYDLAPLARALAAEKGVNQGQMNP